MPSSLPQVADSLFRKHIDGDKALTTWIRERRDDGLPWRQISMELHQLTDGELDLPTQTLHNWVDGYAPEQGSAA